MEGWAPFESSEDLLPRFGVSVGKCNTNESSKEICTNMTTSSRSRMWQMLKLNVMMMMLSLQIQCTHMNDMNEASFLISLTTRQSTSFGQLHYSLFLCRNAGRCRQNNIRLSACISNRRCVCYLLLHKILYYELPAASVLISVLVAGK